MNEYHTFCLLFFIAIIITVLNSRFTRIQTTIAITAVTLFISILLKAVADTQWALIAVHFSYTIQKINFEHFLLHGILGLLLFAGGLGINFDRLKKQKWEVLTLAVAATLISTGLVGVLLYTFCQLVNFPLNFIHCLLFGALISPTDPIAVLAIIKKLGAPESITTQIEGESLFNDGIGLVIFTSIFTVSFSNEPITLNTVGQLFMQEALGGILVGGLFGLCCHYSIKAMSSLYFKIILTLFLATGGYSLAESIDVSAPLAMVVSGIIIGNWSRFNALSPQEAAELDNFWQIIDECLNSVLFAMVGFTLLVVSFNRQDWLVATIAVPIVLVARYFSVSLCYQFFAKFKTYNPYSVGIIAWGGLRGGLAIAMALSIPADIWLDSNNILNLKQVILAMTYAVVIFSILIQGSTISGLVRKANRV
ncbi:sodium:proton antiporter [Photobacterium rosenbergii]|uniref:Sodium:proton antiporter n=1 Tax=Photobacterium rosenbergii TaxID=294936 RepID=A0ABU3ZEN2_9GAMM|nr:sodium:proton antiporter [Photobacterium rosenbergii]MDV5168552.1 sodium:proton antiporter [Photobacterium rosenbergii]